MDLNPNLTLPETKSPNPSMEAETDLTTSSTTNNKSSTQAEYGTSATGGTQEDPETSSIEALNWSDIDEEEMSVQKNIPEKTLAEALKAQGISESVDQSDGSLSTSLLQSINSNVSEDDQAVRNSVIENWASNVKIAAERGEIEIEKDFAEQSTEKIRSRKGGKGTQNSSHMTTSTTESKDDPLSNAPVLDDGPIWNKGPKRYTFQENRRINQKLTIGVILSLVLAIGLGLGNLVAYNECEAEHKATVSKDGLHLPESVENDNLDEEVSKKISPEPSVVPPIPSTASINNLNDKVPPETNSIPVSADTAELPSKVEDPNKPILDPKYADQAETLARVVKGLDDLARKIDLFENATRKLGGVIVLKYEDDEKQKVSDPSAAESLETTTTETPLFEEERHSIDNDDQTEEKHEKNFPKTEEADPLNHFFTEMRKVISQVGTEFDDWVAKKSNVMTEKEKQDLKKLWEIEMAKFDAKMKLIKDEFAKDKDTKKSKIVSDDSEIDLNDMIFSDDFDRLSDENEADDDVIISPYSKERNLERQSAVDEDDIIIGADSDQYNADQPEEKMSKKPYKREEPSKAQKRREKLAKKFEKKMKKNMAGKEKAELKDKNKSSHEKGDWQTSRAKWREQNRYNKKGKNFDEKEDNWQIERDRHREKSRFSKTKVR